MMYSGKDCYVNQYKLILNQICSGKDYIKLYIFSRFMVAVLLLSAPVLWYN